MVFRKRRLSGTAALILTGFLFILTFPQPSHASYLLNLGQYSPEEAEQLFQRLSRKGYRVYVVPDAEQCEVRLGSYDSRDKAEAAAEQLKQDEKIDPQIKEEEDRDQYQLTWDEDDPGREVSEGMPQEYSDPNAQRIVSLALDLFGHPYKYGGTRIGKGIDCSFFTQTIFKELGIALPRTSGEQFKTGAGVEKLSLKVGDLVFFQKTYISKKRRKGRRQSYTRINHVGIYIGNGEFIHCTINQKRVTISRLDEPYFVRKFAGARRVLQ